ncbi:MAG TPA: tetratricopeptide repeat protein [Leptospiraceae bacterium]|nr:tetratricopeptide repeat protein [Leptospiraceae bacterium]HMX34947.1 tetratricopeptide repeat protein [Leptospiraceae bacterium]HMY34281.1 tetratricopeptide repeat protein [Leptospiraceae bacterium]HMZ64081.1 tetratricopeptide repeat protein [Leptospiraceae bacterium]HNA08809.1 tetratricopeptide repeat protein [Leptospiraceae bacterium]
MEPIKKNRLKFESVEPETNPGITQYETDEYSTMQLRQRTSTPLPWILLFLVLIIALGGASWYYFFGRNGAEGFSKGDLADDKTGSLDRILERPYMPASSTNPRLAECINLYLEKYQKKAETKCEEFLNRPESDQDKSIALTVLGVIHDEKGRYAQAIEYLRKAIAYDSKNIYAYYDLAIAYKHDGRMSDARTTIQKAKDLAPRDEKVSLLAGNLLYDSSDPKAAIEAYKDGLSSSPDDPSLVYNLALAQYKQGMIPEAIENFRKAIQSGGSGQIAELAHGHLGSIFYYREDLNGAEHHFRQAVTLRPNDARYLYNLGIVLIKKKNTEEAVSFLQKALDAGATDPSIYRYIAESFEDLKMHDNAIASLEKAMRLRPDDIDTLVQLADLYYNRGNLSQAEETFRKVIRITHGDSNTESARVNLGIILDDMERYGEAIFEFEKAIELNPKNENAYYNLGIAYKHAGQPTKALESWRKAYAINPNENKYKEAIGDYYLESNYLDEAAREYEDIAKANQYNYKVRLKLADAYFRKQQYDLAEKNLIFVLNQSKNAEEIKLAHRKLALVYSAGDSKNKTKAKDEAYRGSHIDPDDMEGRLVLAKVLIDSNSLMDREKAIDELTAIIRSDVKPKLAAKAYNYLGVCLYKNKEYKRALQEFQNAIDLDPNLTEAYDNKRAARAEYEANLQSKQSSIY